MCGFGLCNYCSLQRYKNEAKEKNMKVHLIPSDHDGIDVYVTPKGEKPDTRKDPKTGNPISPYFRSWFMELSDRCVC